MTASLFLLVVLGTNFMCTEAWQNLGEPCDSSWSECPPNAACDSAAIACTCNTGYVASLDDTACLEIQRNIGDTCDPSRSNCPANAECDAAAAICTCNSGYLASPDRTACMKDPTATDTQDKGENTANSNRVPLIALSASTAAVVVVFVTFAVTCVCMLATGMLKFRGKEEQPAKQPVNLAVTLHPKQAGNQSQGSRPLPKPGATDAPSAKDHVNSYSRTEDCRPTEYYTALSIDN